MPQGRDILKALLHDRPLQIGVVALVVVSAYFIQDRGSSPRANVPNSLSAEIPPHLLRDLEGREPLIVQLPASDNAALRAAKAQIAGRAVLVRDENGTWHRMEPARSADGRIQDLSETLEKVSTLMCRKNGADNAKLELPEITEEQRRLICEFVPEDAK